MKPCLACCSATAVHSLQQSICIFNVAANLSNVHYCQRLQSEYGLKALLAITQYLAGTFHSTAARFLRKHVSLLPKSGRNNSFQILDHDESIDTMTSILKENGLAPLEHQLAAGQLSTNDFKAAVRSNVSSVSSVDCLHCRKTHSRRMD